MDLRDQLQTTLTGSYILEHELGGGGMSRVFVAEELRLKRQVVVKVLSPELAQGISVERFEREIQTVAALQHANIVPVLAAGDSNGLPFYTMPYVEGESLRARVGRGPLAATEVIGILRDVSKALAYAHQRGIVHRDIKPDNVLISGGVAVVTDFGIAKAISASRTGSGGATLTQVGTSIGTPAYMAPEQAAGDPGIDARADIYSLGAMAYELLSGRVVFADRTPQRMLAAHMAEAPAQISAFRADLPAPLAALVMQCLAKDANDRPQSAAEIARALETMTSGSGVQAMPAVLLGGAGMFRKALAIYAAAFVAVAVLAKVAIVVIGLPDWVFPGALIVMALGLPVVLWTGYVQRITRQAMTATPTFTPGGSPVTTAHGTIATMALKAAPGVTWYRTARGGLIALGGFVVLIAAFMGLRALGIGPFGSLLASGALKQQDRVIFTDFTVAGGDSSLGRVVSDAMRTGLSESSVVSVVAPDEIASALQRMQRPASERISLDLSRQIARRDGIKAIVDGSVTQVGGSYIVAVSLLSADSARELMSYRGTASGPDKLIDVADKAARALRGKAGESLRRVQGTAPLAKVTTGSLAALRKYGEGYRVLTVDRNYPKAVAVMREAVAIDSEFAEAWRALGVALSNAGSPRAPRDSAVAKAYQLRDRLPEHERDVVTAEWYRNGPGRDRAKAVATFEAMLARGDSVGSAYNLGVTLRTRREFARSDSLLEWAARHFPANMLSQLAEFSNFSYEGRFDAADSLLVLRRARYPGEAAFRQLAILNSGYRGRIAETQRSLDSARKAPDPRYPTWTLRSQADFAGALGELRAFRSIDAQLWAADSVNLYVPAGRVRYALGELDLETKFDLPLDNAIRHLDDALAKLPRDTPYFDVARALAAAHRPDRARVLLARYAAEIKDTSILRDDRPRLERAQAEIALAEKRWRDAINLLRASDRLPDGPAQACPFCMSFDLIRFFASAGMPDSALAEFEAYRRTPFGSAHLDGPSVVVGAPLYELLGRLYEENGSAEQAAEQYRAFIELWKNADPELQPRVAEARRRLAKLAPVEKPRN